MTRKEKIEKIKEVIYKWEDALSDGFKWYCGSNDQENVDQYIEDMAIQILDSIKEKKHEIQDWRIS